LDYELEMPMPEKNVFDRYILTLRKTKIDEKTEHTDRAALQALLQVFADESGEGTTVQHEPKRVADKGAPDFKVTSRGLILGYVENKAIGEQLDKVLKSDQITRYKSLSQNIIITDYLHFIWISKDGIQLETLCHTTDLENPRFRLHQDRILAVSALLRAFFSTPPEGIDRAQQLALALATRSRLLRDYLGEELVRQEHEHKEGRLYGLFQIFRDQVFHELILGEFADALAQMLAYGLFLARLNSGLDPITLHNAREYVPGSFRLIRELVDFLTELEKTEYRDVRWVVEEVLSIVNALKLSAIEEDLSFRRRKAISSKVRAGDEEEYRLFERDPFIYFYEDYLKSYDAATRKARGVYYTPPPIVNFIVRAMDDILKDTFGIRDGLADNKRVTVLDFACGTGTFLLEVFQRIFDNIGGSDSGRADLIVREHFLRHIFGFEYLIAPYTIAHLKLSQYLRDKEHQLKDGERLQIFLTNTLEPIEPQRHLLLPAVTAEVEAAQKVKDRHILVITGNPPYAGHSKNPSERIVEETIRERRTKKGVIKLSRPVVVRKKIKTAIGALIEDYKLVDGKPLGEQNAKWLQDDYVKFIRFAQNKMEAVAEGIVGIITNHSYLDNPTFRGMRQSLTKTFDQIYILDLHGSSKPREKAPSNQQNENVFDIQKGVAIALFVKKPGATQGVWFSEFWGTRLQKYKSAAEAQFDQLEWRKVPCFEPHYMFRPIEWSGWDEYQLGWQVADSMSAENEKRQIFGLSVLGFQTHRDDFSIGFERRDIERRIAELRDKSLTDEVVADRHFPPASNEVSRKRKDRIAMASKLRLEAQSLSDWQRPIITCAYRPFDVRWCYFANVIVDRPRRELLDHVAWRENLLLLVSRQVGIAEWRHVAVSNEIAESCYVSDGTTEQNYCFPIRLYLSGKQTENLSPVFRHWLDEKYNFHYSPEEIFGYMFAILNAPTYRKRYAEFLRIDFPRVPFPESANDFEGLSGLGWALVQAHLLNELPQRGLAAYCGKGAHTVEGVRYSSLEQTISINKTQFFKPIPEAVWGFHIGGYPVLDKYLRSRKGRTLSLDEINHVAAIADSLAFTIDQMAKIDKAYIAAFPNRG
jgi:predicted helicase